MGGWITPRPGRFAHWNDPVSIVQKAEWASVRSQQVRKTSLPPGTDPRTVETVAGRYIDWAIPTQGRFTYLLNALKSAILHYEHAVSLSVSYNCHSTNSRISTNRLVLVIEKQYVFWEESALIKQSGARIATIYGLEDPGFEFC